MKLLKHWGFYLALGLLCNGLGILLKSQSHDHAAITLVVIGIINVATSLVLHHRTA